MHEDIIARAAEIVAARSGGGNAAYCTLTLIDADGYPVSTTISLSRAEGLHRFFFCTGAAAKADIIARCRKASVCFNAPDYHIALSGDIEQLSDPETRQAMWYDGLHSHFSGPEDPDYCVLRLTARRYSLLVDWQQAKGTF